MLFSHSAAKALFPDRNHRIKERLVLYDASTGSLSFGLTVVNWDGDIEAETKNFFPAIFVNLLDQLKGDVRIYHR